MKNQDQRHHQPPADPLARATPGAAQPIRVLVLDDEELVRTLTKRTLSAAGCLVETAAEGRQGLQILLQRGFDVLVVDLRMQGMDGLAFLQEALKIWPWLGVVIISGFLDDQSLAQLRTLGVHRALEKPLNMTALLEEIQAEARAKRAQVDASTAGAPDRAQNQLSVLRSIGEMAITSESLVEALRGLGAGLGRLLPSSVVGILNLERGNNVLLLNCQEPVAEAFLERMQRDMLQHYVSLSGHPLSETALRLQREGEKPDPHGAQAAQSMFTVPIIVSGQLRGLLNLASSKANAFTAPDISFLYHAANQLSTVLVALSHTRELAIRDALTGVYNRGHLEEELDHAWKMAERYSYRMGVAMMDIDHFKQLNDTHGHPAGDQILREFAQLVQRVARASDVVGRYGGDEFVAILSKIEEGAVQVFGERLLRAVRQHVFCESTLRLHLTCSLGIASNLGLEPPRDIPQLWQQTDYALYAAKRGGRNRSCVWSPELVRQQEAPPPPAPASPAEPAPGPGSAEVRGRILVVDDDELVGRFITRALEMDGCAVTAELSATAAKARLEQQPGHYDVIFIDLIIAHESGLELLQYLESKDRFLIKVMMTGYATADNAITSLRHGAYDFVQKPLSREQLIAVVDRALTYKKLLHDNARYQLHLEDMVREKSAALAEAFERIKQSYEFTLEALVAMLDARERTTGQHSQRARKLALILGREIGLTPAQLDDLGHGALLHDIGKSGIPDTILLNANTLTPEQKRSIERHPEIGYNIVCASPYLEKAAEIVFSHHERWDGCGYPRGLKGQDIPLGARIFSVIDAYDAMRSSRSYAEIRRNAGAQFDPAVVEAFLRCQVFIEQSGEWDA
ncbi:MAG: diguanylate cyclase [Kiritimatiellaeota bacterium]|nr:diguanylate cyclase [Kiritimatiellota bacterium]